MKRSRIHLASRVAALALVLAACDDDGISTPQVLPALAGRWLAVETTGTAPQGYRTEDRLELQPDGDYVWISVVFGPGGRTSDGMMEWTHLAGDWGVDGEMLALRTSTGSRWYGSAGGGSWSIMDFGGEWNRGHRVRLEGDRLILTEEPGPPPPNVRQPAPRTYVFQRVSNFNDAPQPPGSS